MTKSSCTEKFLRDVIDGGTTEVFRVSDGHIFVFTKEKLQELLRYSEASANIHKKVIVFVKHRTEEDIN